MAKKVISGFLVDLDGTLLNTEILQYEAFRRALYELFKYDFTRDRYKSLAGKSHLEISKQIIEENNFDIKPEELKDKKLETLSYLLKTEDLNLMPYAKEAITFFRRLPFAIVTNEYENLTRLKLERSGIVNLIDDCPVITLDEKTRPKSAPDLYLKGARALSISR